VGLSFLESHQVWISEAFLILDPVLLYIYIYIYIYKADLRRVSKIIIIIIIPRVSKSQFLDTSYQSVFKGGSKTKGIKIFVILNIEFLFFCFLNCYKTSKSNEICEHFICPKVHPCQKNLQNFEILPQNLNPFQSTPPIERWFIINFRIIWPIFIHKYQFL
jgi:hypothetical protein